MAKRKPPEMPKWFFLELDGCWFCKKRNSCNSCKAARIYRKKYFGKKIKGNHDF